MSGKQAAKKGLKQTNHSDKTASSQQNKVNIYRPTITSKIFRRFDPFPPRKILDNLGTVHEAVKERKIVSALSVMPVKFLKTLYYGGWILKTNERHSKYSFKTLASLHPNGNLARTFAEKYDAGLVWTNDISIGLVQWSKLKPWIMINRFPRDEYTEIKLCGYGMLGKSEYDDYHPRTYPNTTVNSGFMQDFALTACVSLLRIFIDKKVVGMRFGKVTLSALRFAVEKCSAYITDGKLIDIVSGEETGEWNMFFNQYRKIVNGKHHVTAARPRSSDHEELCYIEDTARDLVAELNALRPQTRLDGYNNIWILKSKRPAITESILFNDVGKALKHCPGLNAIGGGNDYVVQKYVETPLLNGNHKFVLHVWLVISTLDERLSIWVHQSCNMQTSAYEFSLDVNGHRYSPNAHMMQKLDRMHSTTKTVNLSMLKSKLKTMMVGVHGKTEAVSSRIKSSIVSAITAATNDGTVLNLRPNCFELFQASFVVANNLRPWLINIRSDPTPMHSTKFNMQYTMGDIAKNMAKIIVCKNRVSKSKIGSFELVHKGSIPGELYKPREFVVVPVPKKPKDNQPENDYMEGFPSADSDSSVESSDDSSVESSDNDSEDDLENGPGELEPQQSILDGPKIDLELYRKYLNRLDQVQKSIDIIRKYSINTRREN